MKISDIRIGERHRKDMGDLQALADSIEAEGLLQPIGITEVGELVFGQRRLLACRDLLGWTDIPTRKVNVSSITAGEYTENEMRKDFTTSERVGIAEAVRKELGERRGGDMSKVTEKPPSSIIPNVTGKSQLDGRKSREIAAERAGFGSASTLAKATRVIVRGVPELVEAMDRDHVSIHAAAATAALPAEEQRAVIREGRASDVARLMRPGERQDVNPMSKKAHYKHPILKLENIANMLETVAEAIEGLDAKRTAEIPHSRLDPCMGRITSALQHIRRSVTGLTKVAL